VIFHKELPLIVLVVDSQLRQSLVSTLQERHALNESIPISLIASIFLISHEAEAAQWRILWSLTTLSSMLF
jgi:hypothetical protein